MSYPPVTVVNSTNFTASVTVTYTSFFCSSDNFALAPHTSWTAHSRAVCLVAKISVTIHTPHGEVVATPYTALGTSYSQFAIIQTGPDAFEVTRRVSGSDDAPPAGHVEPTEHQK